MFVINLFEMLEIRSGIHIKNIGNKEIKPLKNCRKFTHLNPRYDFINFFLLPPVGQCSHIFVCSLQKSLHPKLQLRFPHLSKQLSKSFGSKPHKKNVKFYIVNIFKDANSCFLDVLFAKTL